LGNFSVTFCHIFHTFQLLFLLGLGNILKYVDMTPCAPMLSLSLFSDGQFSVQQYKLSSNDNFRLEVKEKRDDVKIPILVVQKSLDRETARSHSLILTALDGGKPPKSGNMSILLNVLDINDNAPVFSKDVYSVTLNENVPVGTTIIQVNATDLDDGTNGDVVYSFSNSMNQNIFNLIDINPLTGELTVKGLIDYEEQDGYEIEIRASDKGFAPLTTEKSINIKIVDVNDNAPEIEVTSFSSSIPEDSRPGITVALISVNDLDSGLNGKVICTINEDVPFNLSPSLKDKMFSLVTKSPLDREKQSQYELTITAKDAGHPALSSEKTISVVVSDVNDNSPEFSLSPYTFYLTEGNVPGASVFSVKASDNDENDNLRHFFFFFLVSRHGKHVYYNSLSCSEKVDRVVSCLINLKTVLENPLEVHYVGVEVLDINDHSPSFPEKEKTLEISESVLPGVRIPLQPARDPDGGPFTIQQYKLGSNDHFRLEVKDKGEDGKIPILIVQQSLDREAAGSHSLVLTALDGGKPVKSGEMTILINVLDINDNAPVFSEDVYSVTLDENAPVGTIIVHVNATDLDDGPNGDVVYSFSSIVNSRLLKLFDINPTTGEITVKSHIDYEEKDKYEIEIQASDKGLAPLSTQKSVIVKIVDVNDNAPEIEVTSFSSSIPEDSRPGTTVALISVNDLDSGLNGKVICSIGKDVPFTLSPSLQDKMFSLVTKSPLDREKMVKYELTITAKDAGQPPLSSEKTISIVVSDVNDNSPEFSLSPYTFYVTEGNVPGASVFSVKASDNDENDNEKGIGKGCVASGFVVMFLWSLASAQLRYSISEETNEGTVVGNIAKDLGLDKRTLKARKYRIVSSSAEPLFHVNQNDGNLYVSRKIDREEVCAQSSTCVINVKTVLENPLEVHYVGVDVVDINDHSPVFPEDEKMLEISESVLPGARFQLKPSRDLDSGQFSVQQYKLNHNEHFRLEVRDKGDDGKIPILVLQKALDREAARSHSLVLTALDGGKPPKSGNMNILVNVLDVNDNTAIFSKDLYSVMLYENAPVGTEVIQVNATDLDDGQNGEVVYSFGNSVSNNLFNLFGIDQSTGKITVKGLIDYEQKDKYEIEIQASDKSFAPLTTENSVIIEIVDVNDNAPEIELTSFSSSIPEDSRTGTTVALISVDDLDSGLNGKVICSIGKDVPFALTPSVQEKMFSLFAWCQCAGKIPTLACLLCI
uniref:Cadherin domain-containing protein n=1 Tax=Amphilophus citrinellus TaxID=61819 RepID=A0A3Q0S039_AMPCI